MILNTGCRTDIPAYYSEWFYNRIRAGYVMTRNPYRQEQVLKYCLTPDVVDIICFCTKNPQPMLSRIDELKDFRQFWFVTLTPYGKEIEPFVPNKEEVLKSIKSLSKAVGAKAVGWRYDPIFITEKYSVEFHLQNFERIAAELQGKINSCVFSFLDLYEKTKRNFPTARAVTNDEQEYIAEQFAKIAKKYGIPIRSCCENSKLSKYGVDVSGCMTKIVLETATNCHLTVPKKKKSPRSQCNCLLGADIGMYNTCPHGCVYCYANYNQATVQRNIKMHNPNSPLLIGEIRKGDIITEARQETYIEKQLSLF